MSKIGRNPISIPQGTTVQVSDRQVVVKGPKGELTTKLVSGVKIEISDDQVVVARVDNEKQSKANHGLMRSLINNSVIGVNEGYKKVLKMVGTGYRVQQKGADINLQVGFSHDVSFKAPQGVTLKVEGNDTIIIESIDKQRVGQVAAEIRKVKKPEPYKGKGIRYQDEVVKRKQGKASVA